MRHRVLVLGLLVVAGASAMAARQASQPPRQPAHRFQRIAEGVYAAMATGTVNTVSNSAVIVNDDDVVVVDSHATPAAARALIDDIKTLTPKPVRYVIDTHYHWDHAHGNQAFGPDVTLIGHEFVRQMLLTNTLEGWSYRSFVDPVPGQVANLRKQVEAEADPARKATLAQRLSVQEAYAEALKEIRPTPPSVTYSDRMTLVRGSREIQLRYFGRGHTAGDTVVYLPKERVIVTGDLIVGAFPFMFMGDGFVNEWPDTVEKVLQQLDFDTVIPGHGDPYTDKQFIRNMQAYWRDLWTKAQALKKQGVSAEDAAKRVDMTNLKAMFPSLQNPGVDVRAMIRMYDVMDGRQLPR
jgi:glyoxylase-like metal-dependent hydrolase (beta-lactamase superfamily II)